MCSNRNKAKKFHIPFIEETSFVVFVREVWEIVWEDGSDICFLGSKKRCKVRIKIKSEICYQYLLFVM